LAAEELKVIDIDQVRLEVVGCAPMKRTIPWTLALLFFVAFVASFAELHRLRIRFGEATRHQFHDHQEVREFIIRASLEGLDHPVVIIGDSLAEMAEFPKFVCGNPVVNAGIGGSQTSDFLRLAPKLLEHSRPSAIIVALGANDPSTSNDSEPLLQKLRALSPVVLSMPTPRDQFPATDLFDGVHLNRRASAAWVTRITAALEHAIEGCD
jgi:hypothetical protein